jgi:NAD-dependent deacetylase
MEHTGIPKCSKCHCTVKPDVVLYEEGLNQYIITESINQIRQADVLIVGGTSLSVYPAAGLVDYFKGDKLVVNNRTLPFRFRRHTKPSLPADSAYHYATD